MKRMGPSSRRDNLDTRPAEGRTRLTRSVALGLMVFLALVVLGHLIYWDAVNNPALKGLTLPTFHCLKGANAALGCRIIVGCDLAGGGSNGRCVAMGERAVVGV